MALQWLKLQKQLTHGDIKNIEIEGPLTKAYGSCIIHSPPHRGCLSCEEEKGVYKIGRLEPNRIENALQRLALEKQYDPPEVYEEMNKSWMLAEDLIAVDTGLCRVEEDIQTNEVFDTEYLGTR